LKNAEGGMKKKIHFSYLEVIIAVILIGAAGIKITPQLTEASDREEMVCKLIDGLETMRVQIELYRIQHRNRFPPTESFAIFETAMTTKVGRYGPYIVEIPTNPFNGLKTVRFNGLPAGTNEAGWRFDTKTGLFQADNNTDYAAL
jgi:type II secretory pathway pseudopilin PulG